MISNTIWNRKASKFFRLTKLYEPIERVQYTSGNFGHAVDSKFKPITELSRSVWENHELCREYRPHCVWSVLRYPVKILPYRPSVQLIRALFVFL